MRLINLPPGEGGVKQGVDDYLAAGHTLQELLGHATPELKRAPEEDGPILPYRATPAGLVWEKPTQNGVVPTPLTNFSARIVADVAEDDGAEVVRRFEMEAELDGRRHAFVIPSAKFAGMGWPTEHLGGGAIVYPGFGLKDHARAAIQMLSGRIPARRVFAHTGWREIGGEWMYLHAGGAIGRAGRTRGIRTELAGSLAGRTLPDPPEGEELRAAIRATIGLWELAPEVIAVPLFGAVYRAAMEESDFSIHLSGPTGEGKSELAALYQQHYGAGLDARRLLSWESTENAVEAQAFALKDQLLVLDDFAPAGSAYDVQRWHKKADRILRAKGNQAGRQRMRPDTTLRPEKPPRALILSTGEDVPRGQSLRARMLVLELGPGVLDWRKLARCQREAGSGLYAQAMSGFLRWLAGRYEGLGERLRKEQAALRERAGASRQHRRTPGIVADLALGLRHFLLFAHDASAISTEEAQEFWQRGWRALGGAAAAQPQHQAANEPARRFRELLSAAIASGRAHVASPRGDAPATPGAWGWRLSGDEWRPLGERVGWLEGGELYLEPEAAYAAVQKQGRDSGDPLTVTGRTLRRRLHERGLLLSVDEAREVLTVRRTLGGSRRDVLHTSDEFLSMHTDEPDQPDRRGEEQHERGHLAPPLWSGFDLRTRPYPDHEPDRQRDGQAAAERWSGPDREPDQQNASISGEDLGDGRVGRVAAGEREREGGVRSCTPRPAGRGPRVSARALLEELEQIGVQLRVDGAHLEYEGPEEVVTPELLHRLREHKPSLMKLLEWKDRELEDAGRRGLLVRWSEYPTWIALRDPATAEWHEVKASGCSPGVVESANQDREKGGCT